MGYPKNTGVLEQDQNLQQLQAYPASSMVDGAALTKTITNASRSTTTATITSAAHGLAVGQSVTIALTGGPTGYTALNGTFIITGVATDTFTYTTSTTGTITSGAATGTAVANFASPVATGTSTIGLTVPAKCNGVTIQTSAAARFYGTASDGSLGYITLSAGQAYFFPCVAGDVLYVYRGGGTATIEFIFGKTR